MNNFASAKDLVEIKEIRGETIVMKDGGLRQIIMVSGINFALKSEEEQNVITSSYQSFLNSLDFPVQIVIHSRKINIENYLKRIEAKKAEEKSAILQDQMDEYIRFIQDFVKDNAIMSKNFFVVISFSPISIPSKAGILDSLPFMKKKAPDEKALKEEENVFREHEGQLKQRVAQAIDGLSGMGLSALVLKGQEVVELLYNFYNPETTEKKNVVA